MLSYLKKLTSSGIFITNHSLVISINLDSRKRAGSRLHRLRYI